MKTELEQNTEPANSRNTLLAAAKPSEKVLVTTITSDGVKREEITKEEHIKIKGCQLSQVVNDELIQKAKNFMWSKMDERTKSLLITQMTEEFVKDLPIKEIFIYYSYIQK